MSCYYCERCDELKDNDHDVCVEDPEDNTKLICEECALDLEEE